MSDGQNQEISPATAQVGPLPATDFPTIYRLLVKLDYRQQDEIRIWNGNCIAVERKSGKYQRADYSDAGIKSCAANTRKPNRWPIKSGTWAEKCRRRWKLCLSEI